MPDDKDKSFLPAAAAALPIVGGIFNAVQTSIQNKKTREWQEKMYGVQRNDALSDWRMQNQYNSPEAQMARLKAAGLNPNLVYGNGATATSSQAVRSSSAGSWSPHAPQVDTSSMVSGFLDAKVRQAQLDNLAVQREVMEQDIKNKIANELKTYADADKSKSTRDLIDSQVQLRGLELANQPTKIAYQLEAMKLGLNKTTADIDKTIQDTKLSQANTLYRLSENERASIRLDQSLRESVARIVKMRADTLRAEAATQTEFYRRQELMNQAMLLERRYATEDVNRRIKEEEHRLKSAEPTYYEKQYTQAIQNVLKMIPSLKTRTVEKYQEGQKNGKQFWEHSNQQSY